MLLKQLLNGFLDSYRTSIFSSYKQHILIQELIFFCSFDTRIFVSIFFYKSHNMFPLFLYEVKSKNVTYNREKIFNNIFIAFGLIILSDLNSSLNNFNENEILSIIVF